MKALVDNIYILEKFPGKGGWTYAAIPEVLQDKNAPFGWVKVKGSIDGYEIQSYHLMPMGNGKLFLPVKAEIRKKIKKQVGDFVHVILFADTAPALVPDEFLQCLQDEPEAFNFFKSLSESEQQLYIKWIYATKNEEVKIQRMAKSINQLSLQQKFQMLKNT